jgi:mRNA-degrading endonuclease RelE of RelBE toxin-antitoxin system
MTIKCCSTLEFKKDFKKLSKKFKTLENDLKIFVSTALVAQHIKKVNITGIYLISGFCRDDIMVFKVTKFACRALKGRGSKSGIRIIYAFDKTTKKVTFLEIYFKGNKPKENQERIKKYFKLAVK